MKLLEKLNTLERLDQLIRMKATGTPQDLADRLEISKRNVYNLLNDLRMLGAEISYDSNRQSYQYDEQIYFDFRLVLSDNESVKTKGGIFPLIFFADAEILHSTNVFCIKYF